MPGEHPSAGVATHSDGLPRTPYRSLASFGPEDRALFVGRDDDIGVFVERLDDPRTRIIFLHGQSGVGKSSFLLAGVIPLLEDESLGYGVLRARHAAAN